MATSRSEPNSSPKTSVIFNCDYFIQFCQRFQQTPTEKQSETVLKVKLKSKWGKLDSFHEKIMLSVINCDHKFLSL